MGSGERTAAGVNRLRDRPKPWPLWQLALAFVALGMGLHVVLFFGLAHIWAGAIYLSLPGIGLALGAVGWLWFQASQSGRFWRVFGLILLLTLITAGLLLVAQLETAICIVVGLPIYAPAVALGMLGARYWLRRRDAGPRTYAVLLGLPVLAMALDAHAAYPQADYAVQTVIDIAAPPAQVWAQTLEIAPIQADERIWTVAHNLLGAPQPVSAVLTGETRHLQWTKGVVFQEIITERVTAEYLGWDFAFHAPETLQAFDLHVAPNGYFLRMTRGEYRLQPTQTGTRLILQSQYRLHTPFNGYLRLWGEVFLQDFHRAVLAVIKSRAEVKV